MQHDGKLNNGSFLVAVLKCEVKNGGLVQILGCISVSVTPAVSLNLFVFHTQTTTLNPLKSN